MSGEGSIPLWLPWLGGLALKSLIVFGLAGLALLALRRASASARHLVCLLTLATLLLLPLLSLTLPGWRLPISLVTPPAVSAPVPSSPIATTSPAPAGTAAPTPIVPLAPPSAQLLSLPVSPAPPRPFPWPLALVALWLLGVFLASLRPLLGLWGIGRLRRDCRPVTDATAVALAQTCAAALRLKRLPMLWQADVPVPMTWGWRRPVVLLPRTAETWPADRLRAVLLHEQAHIRRGDWLWHRLADVVCALYWFHPFAWWTARRLRAESEAACDDLVLASGIAAPDYARHLLEIARALPPVSIVPQVAIAMAQTSQVESRLKMILDQTQGRRQTTQRVLFAMLGLGAVVLLPLAALRPVARAQATASAPTAPDAAPAGPSAAVPVELAGITDGNGGWWDASGKRLPWAPYQRNGNGEIPGQRGLMFTFRLPQAAHNVTVNFDAPGSFGYSSSGTLTGKMRGLVNSDEATLHPETGDVLTLAAHYPVSATKEPLWVGVAAGPWKVSLSEMSTRTGERGQTGGNDRQLFLLSPVAETAKGLLLTLTTNAMDDLATYDTRVVAVDAQGRELLPASIGEVSIGKLDQLTVRFSQPLSQIKSFRVETRPFVWTEFKDVALKPVQ